MDPTDGGDRERLEGWGSIAEFLHCDMRTAQRYEKYRGLPVRRLPGPGRGHVFSYKEEVLEWLDASQRQSVAIGNASHKLPGLHRFPEPDRLVTSARDPRARSNSSVRFWISLCSVVLVLISVALTSEYFMGPEHQIAKSSKSLFDSSFPKTPPLLTDGQKIYFQQVRNGSFELNSVPSGTGGAVRLESSLHSPELCAISPDGSALLVRDIETDKNGDEPLYIQPLSNGVAKRVGEIVAYDAAWFPDGVRILFSQQNSLYLATTQGAGLLKITDLPGRAYWFRWAPDGKTVRFTVYNSKTSTYRIWELDGRLDSPASEVSLGVGGLAQQCCGSWNRDGSTYYFQASINGHYQLFAQTHGIARLWQRTTQLTSGPADIRSPVPLPDGKHVVTLSRVQNAELSTYEQETRRWLPYLEGIPIATAVCSRDGRWLAYTKLPDHTLWRCAMPGCADSVRLTRPPLRATMPRWSPDGTRIACMTQLPGEPWRISFVGADGSGAVAPLQAEAAEADPDWSPSGDSLVYGRVPSPIAGGEGLLHILDLKSQATHPVPGSQGHHSPRWSPAGDTIAAIKADSMEIGFYNLAKQSWTYLRPGGRVGYPNWSADGSRLYVLAGVGSSQARIVSLDPVRLRMDPDGVVPLVGLRQPAFSFGDWIGLAPNGQPLALRDLSSEFILSWSME